jgi:hypothetical protein
VKVKRLREVLEGTEAEIVEISSPVFLYNPDEFEITDERNGKFAVGSLRVYEFDEEEQVKKRFRKSKLFVKSCNNKNDKKIIRAFEWREKPWLK